MTLIVWIIDWGFCISLAKIIADKEMYARVQILVSFLFDPLKSMNQKNKIESWTKRCIKVIKINEKLLVFLLIQTVTVLARFLGMSGFICFSLAIFSTKICIGIIDIKWLTYGSFGISMIESYFWVHCCLLLFLAYSSKAASIFFLQSVTTAM